MKNIRVIAREEIIDPKTGKAHDDTGLIALDGYYQQDFQVHDVYDQNTLNKKN